ncbi:MAG: hypothetical protein KBF26_02065 [Opitutaceae bacterium]|nr:hypothetical protein [Opitutaceae bacterium]
MFTLLLELLRCGLVFALLSTGLAWPLVARLPLAPLEKIVASTALSLIALWLFGWALYVWDLPWIALWLLTVLAAGGLFFQRQALQETLRDGFARECLYGQLLVSGWCLGLLHLVQHYSGGGWSGDWYEHWDRMLFILQHEPLDHLFLSTYSFTARPPLGNLLTGIGVQLTRPDFAHYQIFSTLFASLVFLPAAMLTQRWGGGRVGIALLSVLFMLNPLFVQNAVFPWTKLPAAFFILAALGFFLRFQDGAAPRTYAVLFSLSLAAGLITHYSAAPYAVVLAMAWCLKGRQAWRTRSFQQATGLAVAAGFVLLATWFGWALIHYGFAGTVSSNTSVTEVDRDAGAQLGRILLNLRDTLVPHFLRSPDAALLAQSSPWGYWRDWFFQSYQLNLLLSLGCCGWAVVAREGVRLWPQTERRTRWFWTGFVLAVVVLGVGAHGARDVWGLTHICLQALVLAGLAFLAARWATLGRVWQRVLIAGATCDLMLGIVLHFAVQNHALDRWLTPGRSALDVITSYNPQAAYDAYALRFHHFVVFNEAFTFPLPLVLALLALILTVSLHRCQSAANES